MDNQTKRGPIQLDINKNMVRNDSLWGKKQAKLLPKKIQHMKLDITYARVRR